VLLTEIKNAFLIDKSKALGGCYNGIGWSSCHFSVQIVDLQLFWGWSVFLFLEGNLLGSGQLVVPLSHCTNRWIFTAGSFRGTFVKLWRI